MKIFKKRPFLCISVVIVLLAVILQAALPYIDNVDNKVNLGRENMRTFNIEPHPEASNLTSCKNWLVLRGDDNKIHAMSRKRSILRKIKERMEKHYNG